MRLDKALGILPAAEGPLTRFRVILMIYNGAWACAIFPLVVAFLVAWCAQCLSLRKGKEHAFLTLGVVIMMAAMLGVDFLFILLRVEAGKGGFRGNVFAVAMIALCASLTLLAVMVFSKGWRARSEEEDALPACSIGASSA